MTWLEFIAEMTDALAWPVAVIVGAWIVMKGYRDSFED